MKDNSLKENWKDWKTINIFGKKKPDEVQIYQKYLKVQYMKRINGKYLLYYIWKKKMKSKKKKIKIKILKLHTLTIKHYIF